VDGIERGGLEHARDLSLCALVEALLLKAVAVGLRHGAGNLGCAAFVRLAGERFDVLDHREALVGAWPWRTGEHERQREQPQRE
jgi:hypothetical protein